MTQPTAPAATEPLAATSAAASSCLWNVAVPVVTATTATHPREVVAAASWTCGRRPKSFQMKVVLEVFQPQVGRWLPHSVAEMNSTRWTLRRRHTLTATTSVNPAQFRTHAWMTVNGHTQEKISAAATLS